MNFLRSSRTAGRNGNSQRDREKIDILQERGRTDGFSGKLGVEVPSPNPADFIPSLKEVSELFKLEFLNEDENEWNYVSLEVTRKCA